MKNILLKNAVKQLEWRMTDILRQELGACQYDWLQSPVRVLRGKKSTFTMCEGESNCDWNGTVSILGDSRLKIILEKEVSSGRKLDKRRIQIIA